MSIRSIFFFWSVLLAGSLSSQSYSIVSNGSGNWNNPSVWSRLSGIGPLPVCGDTIHIQASDIINLNANQNLESCGLYMYLKVSGAMSFSNGRKLRLPSGSGIEVCPAPSIVTGGNGGSQLVIGGVAVWTGSDGPTSDEVFGSPLPVELISFEITEIDNSCALSWSTASEVNNSFFTIERSRDAFQWEILAQIPGAVNSSAQIHYHYLDELPLIGTSYYRLSQDDFDGANEILGIRNVTIEMDSDVSVFPNPANRGVTVHGVDIRSVELIDVLGSTHPLNNVQVSSEGRWIDLADVPAGLYQLRIMDATNTQSKMISIIH